MLRSSPLPSPGLVPLSRNGTWWKGEGSTKNNFAHINCKCTRCRNGPRWGPSLEGTRQPGAGAQICRSSMMVSPESGLTKGSDTQEGPSCSRGASGIELIACEPTGDTLVTEQAWRGQRPLSQVEVGTINPGVTVSVICFVSQANRSHICRYSFHWKEGKTTC